MKKKKITAIVLAGGSGSRMGASCKKQYLPLGGRPVLSYSLQTFQESCVDAIVLVSQEAEYCKKEILEKYGIDKVTKIVPGGKERCDSVYAGLLAAEDSDYVLIHDGARPFLTQKMIRDSIRAVETYHACVIGMPVKDTIKIADEQNYARMTPKRDQVWQIQTPQTFSYLLILEAYRKVREEQLKGITDDAMVLEYGHFAKVRLIPGSYQNIKITTPEDMEIAEVFLRNYEKEKEW